jgi:hypothetical protein
VIALTVEGLPYSEISQFQDVNRKNN